MSAAGAAAAPRPSAAGIATVTAVALAGFAANSLLCRLALRPGLADAATFTTVRVASGALALAVLARFAPRTGPTAGAGWRAGTALFAYAIAFSLAYRRLTAGTGALVLFASVQATMVGASVAAGARPRPLEWAGLALALGGLVWLTMPGLAAPDPLAAALMAAAGVAWGVYSLIGRAARDPLRATAGNFARAVPLALAASALAWRAAHATPAGVALAAVSGALTSGVAYSLWYAALPRLGATRAALVQLSVPVLAAAGGVAWLGEAASLRLAVAAAAILGGIAIALAARGVR